jgi:hypothetical protein
VLNRELRRLIALPRAAVLCLADDVLRLAGSDTCFFKLGALSDSSPEVLSIQYMCLSLLHYLLVLLC